MSENKRSTVERADLRIGETLDLANREWLITKLEHERGVRQAQFHYPDPRCLEITYDPTAFSSMNLLDVVRRHGLSASIVTRLMPQVERVLVATSPLGTSTSQSGFTFAERSRIRVLGH